MSVCVYTILLLVSCDILQATETSDTVSSGSQNSDSTDSRSPHSNKRVYLDLSSLNGDGNMHQQFHSRESSNQIWPSQPKLFQIDLSPLDEDEPLSLPGQEYLSFPRDERSNEVEDYYEVLMNEDETMNLIPETFQVTAISKDEPDNNLNVLPNHPTIKNVNHVNSDHKEGNNLLDEWEKLSTGNDALSDFVSKLREQESEHPWNENGNRRPPFHYSSYMDGLPRYGRFRRRMNGRFGRVKNMKLAERLFRSKGYLLPLNKNRNLPIISHLQKPLIKERIKSYSPQESSLLVNMLKKRTRSSSSKQSSES